MLFPLMEYRHQRLTFLRLQERQTTPGGRPPRRNLRVEKASLGAFFCNIYPGLMV
jgi:hypothetical protein